jgi:hypothetical protein
MGMGREKKTGVWSDTDVEMSPKIASPKKV